MNTIKDFNEFVLKKMPYFIAENYKRMLEEKLTKERINKIMHIFNLITRTLIFILLSQYISDDKDIKSNAFVNKMVKEKFHHMTMSDWQKLLFDLLRAYESKRDLLFIPEIYNFYWDDSLVPNKRRVEIEQLFKKFTSINEKLKPKPEQLNEPNWEFEAKEAESLLNQILENISFLGNYNIIRVLDVDNSYYQFELHKGIEISISSLAIPDHLEIIVKQFYLQNANGDLLPLYPLLMLWEESSGLQDMGLYDRKYLEQVQYMLAMMGKIRLMNIKEVGEIFAYIYQAIEDAIIVRKELEKLEWSQLKDICINISGLRMATVKHKYRSGLYQQRKKIRLEFENFLKSDKRCFVIIGKSGIGKSNFVLALSEELQLRNDICLLVYDGAQLKTDPCISDVISKDFDDRLVIQGKRVNQVWHEIAKVDDIASKKVILLVDGINENPKAKVLLQQLDGLTQTHWPWLKVVFTSRPETWQVIKRGIKLAEALYYQEEGSERLGAELAPFSYSERIDPFNLDEFKSAYEKHQLEFNLKTTYLNLRGELREVLREPLNMWLVANTYMGKEIPEKLKVTELIENYLNSLKTSERLGTKEWFLLVNQLVPLMVNDGHFNNSITVSDVDKAGESLYEIVYGDEIGSDGRAVNEPFIQLLNTEILVRQGEGINQKISFKYERFYEYFIGQELFNNLGSGDTWEEQYKIWIDQVKNTPFLWGAIKYCLEHQMKGLEAKKIAEICIKLAHIQDQRVIDIIISALNEYGSDEPAKVEQVISYLLEVDRNWLGEFINSKKLTKKCPPWKRLGIEVASSLGIRRLLEYALTDPSQSVRAVAIRHAYIFWRRDHKGGFELLENLVDKSTGIFGLPIVNGFEVTVGISLMILFDEHDNNETKNRLQKIWRRTIERLLKVKPEILGDIREKLKGRLRTILIRVITGFIVRTANDTPSNSEISIPELKLFFRKDKNLEKRRTIVRKLVPYLDPEITDLRDIKNDLLELVEERDMFIVWISVIVLTRHVIYHEDVALPILKEIFDLASKINPIGPFCGDVPITSIVLENRNLSDKAKSLEMDMLTTYLERFRGIWSSNLQKRRFTYLDRMCFIENGEIADIILPQTAKRCIEKMIQDEDYLWIKDLIDWDITLQAIEAQHPRLAFSALEILINVKNQSVREAIIELLARMRIYYPDEVENFLETNNLDQQVLLTVRTLTSSESLADLLDLRAVLYWQNAIVISGSQELWGRLISLLGKLAESNSLDQFLTLLLEAVVNQIYGAEVFA